MNKATGIVRTKKPRPFIRYMRDPATRRPLAMVVFFKSNGGGIKFGWSKHNPHDVFSRSQAYVVAMKRSCPVELLRESMRLLEMEGKAPLRAVPAFVLATWKSAKRYFEGPPSKVTKRSKPTVKR